MVKCLDNSYQPRPEGASGESHHGNLQTEWRRSPPRQSSGLGITQSLPAHSSAVGPPEEYIPQICSPSIFWSPTSAFYLQNLTRQQARGPSWCNSWWSASRGAEKGWWVTMEGSTYCQHCPTILAKGQGGQSRGAVMFPECRRRRQRDQDGNPDDHRNVPCLK